MHPGPCCILIMPPGLTGWPVSLKIITTVSLPGIAKVPLPCSVSCRCSCRGVTPYGAYVYSSLPYRWDIRASTCRSIFMPMFMPVACWVPFAAPYPSGWSILSAYAGRRLFSKRHLQNERSPRPCRPSIKWQSHRSAWVVRCPYFPGKRLLQA